MILHDLKISYRSFFKNRRFTWVNLLGLSIALTAFFLIWLYVSFQLSFDQFHANRNNIYRIFQKDYKDGVQVREWSETFKEVGPVLRNNFSGVQACTQVIHAMEYLFTRADDPEIAFNEQKVCLVDSSFLKVFSFPLIKGDPAIALSNPKSAIITASIAKKYFGSEDALGKVLYTTDSWAQEVSWTITGIAQDIPSNSHLQFNILLSADIPHVNTNVPEILTYTMLENSANPKALSAQLTNTISNRLGLNQKNANKKLELSLVPLSDVHLLLNENAKESVTLLSWIAVIILVIALVNFINLTTVQSLDKARQVGVRKVLGAVKNQIIKQSATETLLLHGLSFAIAMVLIILVRTFLSESIPIPFFISHFYLSHWSVLLLIFLMVGMFGAAIYTAFFTASFKPTVVLKGKAKNSKGSITFRKALVVSQFASAILLMVGTFTMYQQLQYIRNASLGINLDRTFIVKVPKVRNNLGKRFDTFKNRLSQNSAIANITATSGIPGRDIGHLVSYQKVGSDGKDAQLLSVVATDPNFVHTFEVELAAGQNFIEGETEWKNWKRMLINEKAVEVLGFQKPEDAINTQLFDQEQSKAFKIIGVVKNYHQKSLKQPLLPMAYRYNPQSWGYFAIKFTSSEAQSLNDLQRTIASIEQTWKSTFESEPFEYFFLDDYFNQQYTNDEQVSNIVTLFTLLAIFVACLGLFSLASYTAIQRTKEIGIRKVHGASVFNILVLLSRQYLLLTLIAWAIAIPVSNFLITEWLQSFAYKIDISIWLFAIPGVLVIIIALFSVLGQTWKAAQTNPVDSLRYE